MMMAMVAGKFWASAAAVVAGIALLRMILFWTVLGSGVRRLWGWLEEWCQVYQWYRIPERNENQQENQLYRTVSLYVSSLASLEDSDFANLVAGRKPGEILLRPDPGRAVADSFLGAGIRWRSEVEPASFVLGIRRRDKRRVLRPYLQHVHAVVDEIEAKRKELRLFTNSGGGDVEGRWRSVAFTHPATMETVAMDPELKAKVKADMESFLKSKQYYHRLGRVWKRSYLLHGPAGTGKTTFVAAMAKFLSYDVYEVDLARVRDDSDLKTLLIQTSPRSLILVEDVDRFLAAGGSPAVTLAGILGFADGIFACCGEERVMVFTMGSRDGVDPALLRPGRLDVHVHFPACDFPAFKVMASSYLGVKEHKLFAAAEEAFAAAPAMSPAEIGEILILHRGSPSRAIKSVISAMQARKAAGWRLPDSGSRREGRSGEDSGEETMVVCGGGGGGAAGEGAGWELKKLYGLLRVRSRRGGDPLEPPKEQAA